MFESRGEYTAAAYHYMRGNQPQLAVWTWFNHRQLEVERGHAPAARELFGQLSEADFNHPDDRRALAILRAEQYLAAGAADDAEAELQRASWPIILPAAAYAHQLQGDVREMQGRIEQALEQYRAAWRVLDALPDRRMVGLRVKAGCIYINRAPDLAQTRREAVLALWQAHNFMGHVEQESGNYVEAQAHYETALRHAQQVAGDAGAQARTQQHLGALFIKMGRGDEAIRCLEAALRWDERSGDLVSALYDRLNLASAQIVAGRYGDALHTVMLALPRAQDIGHSFLVSGLFTCAAEASFYLHRLTEAEHSALQALREEEEAFRAYALTVLGQTRDAQGRCGEAEQILDQAIESARASGDRFAEVAAWRALGEMRAGHGDLDRARQAFESALRLYQALGLTGEAEAIQSKLAGPSARA